MSELTVYATTNDGCVYAASTTYATAHDAASGINHGASLDTIYIQNTKAGSTFYPERGFLYFDTSSLPDGCTISTAILSQYTYGKYQADSGHSDLYVVEGVQADPYTTANFGDEKNKTVSGGSIAYASINSGGYSDITLNSTGIGWISKTGTTRFCLRVKGDIDAATPTSTNEIDVYSADKGTGYKPKLVINYSEGETKTSSDNGSGTEATALKESVTVENGSGTEVSLAAVALTSGDAGNGVDMGGLLQDLFSEDQGAGADSVKILTGKSGSDMRLHNHQGHVSLTHKEVNL